MNDASGVGKGSAGGLGLKDGEMKMVSVIRVTFNVGMRC